MTNCDIPFIDSVLEQYDCQSTAVIAIMQEVQAHHRYLPEDALYYIARKLNISDAKIYSVATFYENFSLEPKGQYVIRVCDGTACHVRKSTSILNALHKELGLSALKHTTDDMLFTVETVSCLGACGLAPVLTVNDHVHPAMTTEKVTELLKVLKEEAANG
ncbi:MAG: NAD(P)H-dependent oxidoreductase subunit E [Eubacteriales bacterium]